MRLLDVATVVTGDARFPAEGDTRSCAASVGMFDECTPADEQNNPVVDSAGDADTYRLRPFSLIAKLNRNTACEQPDDLEWLGKLLEEATERGVARALVTEPFEDALTWVGAPGILQAADVTAGRVLWTDVNFSVPNKRPVLHVSPETLPGLITNDIVQVDDAGKNHFTAWGDPVVVNDSYTGFPSFWTGDITVYLSSVQKDEEYWRDLRGNRVTLQVNRFAEVDIVPCSIVRIGSMP
ncbi:MAG: hypothetical protein ACOYD1_07655 [Candidatus Nanopelagicales bacterium]